MIAPLLLFAQLGAVQLATQVHPDTAYVGQQVSYDGSVLVDDAARGRLAANPDYTPGDVRGATIYDFPFDPASVRDSVINGAHVRVFTYRRALFPLAPGTMTIPPATLRFALNDDASDGQGARPVMVTSAPATVLVLPLPRAGQPIGFSGAVGVLRDSLWTDGSPARVGDTFTATVRVDGVGNLRLLPRPMLPIDWATVVPGEERVHWDSAGTVVRGAKEFDWVVTPKVAGELVIPEVSYDYFDPTTHTYATARTAPMRLTVAAAAGAAPVAVPAPDTIGDSPFPVLVRELRAYPLVVAIAATVVLALVIIAVIAGRRRAADED